jgi:hypothetical protein
VFPGLPKTVSLKSLPKPVMKRSVLASNGLRVASQETYGQVILFIGPTERDYECCLCDKLTDPTVLAY